MAGAWMKCGFSETDGCPASFRAAGKIRLLSKSQILWIPNPSTTPTTQWRSCNNDTQTLTHTQTLPKNRGTSTLPASSETDHESS